MATAAVGYFDMGSRERANLQNKFLNSDVNMPGFQNADFVGGKLLGSGEFGVAGLWLRVNNTGRVVDRVVIKYIKLSPADYGDHIFYYLINGNDVPMEIYCQQVCAPTPAGGRSNINLVRAWTNNPQDHSWRVFLEYCPYGSLNDVAKAYRARRIARRGATRRYIERLPIPEPFLWCVFEGLAQAAIEMEHPASLQAIGRPQTQPQVPGSGGRLGNQVVHQDLKPSNVFLDTSFPNHFQCYPQIKIGDFGKARLTRPLESVNVHPRYFQDDDGTPGFEPPEVTGPPQPAGIGYNKVTAAANIWQIGMIMRCLIRLEPEEDLTDAFNNNPQHPCHYPVPRTNPDAPNDSWVPPMDDVDPAHPTVGHYSQDLRDLVMQCLRVRTAGAPARPTPAALLAAIHAAWGAHLGGMDTRTARLSHNAVLNLGRIELKDNYRAGFAVPRLFP